MNTTDLQPKDKYQIRCPRLGHQISFSYCRIENQGIPCFKTLDCWHQIFDVATLLKNELSPEVFNQTFHREIKPKILSLMDLVEQAKKAIASAELSFKVTEKLYKEGGASEAEYTAAQAQLSGARAGLELAQKAFDDCRVTAPISGYIAQKDNNVIAGSYIAPGGVVTRIVDISSLKAVLPVGETEVGLVRKGMIADITIPAEGTTVFKGKVTAVAAGSDPMTPRDLCRASDEANA